MKNANHKSIISNIQSHLWRSLFVIGIFTLVFALDGFGNIDGYIFLLPRLAIILIFYSIILMHFRNFDIHFLNSKIHIKNRWRILGRRTWDFELNSIDYFEFNLSKGGKNMADIYFWINQTRFNLLLKKNDKLKLFEYLKQTQKTVITNSETKAYLQKKGFKL